MAAHLFSPPPRVTDQLPFLPVALDQVIAIAMAKDPAARFPTASALAAAATAALRDPTRHHPLPAVPSGEVSAYPTSSPAPAWWQHSGPRTMASSGPAPPKRHPAPNRRRRRLTIGAALIAAALLTGTIAAWPEPTGPNPTNSTSAPGADGEAVKLTV